MLRYKLGVFVFVIVCLCTLQFVDARTGDLPLVGKVIFLDAGHGGRDPGATYKECNEADINLAIIKQLQHDLEQFGAIVYLTRDGDYDLSVPGTTNHKRSDLSQRARLINDSNCDLFLSVHLNADSSSSWSGSQVFYNSVNTDNEKIAKVVQESLKKELKTTRDYKKLNDTYLFQRIERPGILIEAGFLSNPSERYLLQQEDYQKKVSKAILQGVLQYFSYS